MIKWRLQATQVEPLPARQISHACSGQNGQLEDLISRLGTRIGLENIQRFLPADSHIPERSFLTAPAAYSEPEGPWVSLRPRPVRLFAPEPIAASGLQPPRHFRWRRMSLTTARATGPERITPEWWLEDENWSAGVRDYWHVETRQGRRLWLFYTPQNPGWFAQGEFAMIEVNRTHRPVDAFCRDMLRTHTDGSGYAELCVTTNFTFLTGASHPEELVTRAAALGLSAIAITDRNSLAGVVRAWAALKELRREAEEAVRIRSQHRVDSCSRQEVGHPQPIANPGATHLPRLIVGCRLVLRDSTVNWVALPRDRAAYQRLTRLLTLGKRRAEKGELSSGYW